MYGFGDTIGAVSSPSLEGRAIIRLSGPRAVEVVDVFFKPAVSAGGLNPLTAGKSGVYKGFFDVDEQLSIEGVAYFFASPNSYTGEDVVEVHIFTNRSVVQLVFERLARVGVRLADPGEFTARRYLNGKIDLSQAEAVNEIIVSSNRLQLGAARRLLGGGLSSSCRGIREELLDVLSLLEAGLDFSDQDIEVAGVGKVTGALRRIQRRLEDLLAGPVGCEAAMELPSVGVAGASGVGKSSLVNRLLGRRRSIVSGRGPTTRDVLAERMDFAGGGCIIFDCAGLESEDGGDEISALSCQASIEALSNCDVVVFCADVTKPNLKTDLNIRGLIRVKELMTVATKVDLVRKAELRGRLLRLEELFGQPFLPTSLKKNTGIDKVRAAIEERIIEVGRVFAGDGKALFLEERFLLTSRHKQLCEQAIEGIADAICRCGEGSEEVAAMLVRSAAGRLGEIERQDIEPCVLERIFRSFCIGK